MRLLINTKGAAEAGLKRYNGRGIFSSIGRKLILSGLKKVINAEERKQYPQKFVDAIVNGPPAKKRVKRKLITTAASTTPTKVRKYSTNTANQLINTGSGIVLD